MVSVLLFLVLISWVFVIYYFWGSFFYMLIIFEAISMFLFLIFCYFYLIFECSFDSVIFFLSFMVIEGGFGLALLIMIVSLTGDDKCSLNLD